MYNLWISEKLHNFEINALVILLEKDVLIVISGGSEHIGAIGVAQPRQSIKDKDKISSTSSVYTFLGHKEDIIVKEMSEGLSKALNKKVVVVAGMHWDDLGEKEIEKIINLCERIKERIIEEILTYEKDYSSHNRGNRGNIRDKIP
ncbi:MAG TPA: hypothetical protein PLM71_02345 [Syntrophorhabdaceae bacterium]|nr:hypothetical protein [Syntrophorhabdaceae bacterium]HPU29144.1 hypothetical protein [Syntrophorhabdaceae bacterium]